MNPDSHIPLSYAQERFWLLDKIFPENPAYNISATFQIKGDLNSAALEKSFNFLVERHESLRTTFPSQAGQPFQKVHSALALPIEHINLQQIAKTKLADSIEATILEKSSQLFRLDQDQLIRITLLQIGPAEFRLLISLHHIISDATSLGLLLQELGTCYSAFSQNQTPQLPKLTLTYPAFSLQQRSELDQSKMLEKLAYWESHLQDCPPLDLPTDRPRAKIQSFNGATFRNSLPQETIQKLRTLGVQNGATLFMVLLAGLKILLSKIAGQEDITIGTPISGRNQVQTENMQGLFINTLALRTTFSHEDTFNEFLGKVRNGALKAYTSMEIPFEKIIETLQPERDQSRPPLFQVID